MLCAYCLPDIRGGTGNYPNNPQDGGEPFIDDQGCGHLPCCGRTKCEQNADDDRLRQLMARNFFSAGYA